MVCSPRRAASAELAFKETALGKKWYETFARREGGRDRAQALEKRFNEMVLHHKTEIVRRRLR